MKKLTSLIALSILLFFGCKKDDVTNKENASYRIEVKVSDLSSYTLYEPAGKSVEYIATGVNRNVSTKITKEYVVGESVRVIATLKPDSEKEQIELVVTNLSNMEVLTNKQVGKAEISFTSKK